ncbi:MAG: HypC/HybG/HupF family hydrogenase formation chaperone [Firmicutes bacterium]|nr:HypC/HybG/HupF family hydrogenase formation chaperone [Bacillota bacterium]
MCLAVPLRISSIDGLEGIGERDGISRSVRLDFIKEPKVGDYVIVHAGFAIDRVDEEQAEEDLRLAKELEDEIRKLRG